MHVLHVKLEGGGDMIIIIIIIIIIGYVERWIKPTGARLHACKLETES